MKLQKIKLHKVKKIINVFVILILIIAIFRIGLFIIPTNGEKITNYKNANSALLVIDIQDDLTGKKAKSPYPYKGSESFINNVNNIIDIAVNKKYKIIYIRQEYKNNLLDMPLSRGILISGQPGTQLDSRLKIVNENVFAKNQSDAFSNKELEKFLISNEINHLYVIGLDANACVYKTAKGGLNRNYKVTAIQDGMITVNMDKMDTILEKHTKNNISIINSIDFKHSK